MEPHFRRCICEREPESATGLFISTSLDERLEGKLEFVVVEPFGVHLQPKVVLSGGRKHRLGDRDGLAFSSNLARTDWASNARLSATSSPYDFARLVGDGVAELLADEVDLVLG